MRLLYTVKGRKGACMLTGPVGSGKTTIAKVFQQKLSKEGCSVGVISNPNLNGTELLQDILYHLGQDLPGTSKVQLFHALQKKMMANHNAGRQTVIVIDEAHLIRDEVYEELRLLLNYHADNKFLVTLILAGQPELTGAIRKSPQFEQRIPIRFHLKPLSFVDTCKYIHFRLATAGIKKNVFSAEAAKSIYRYSGGIPRMINNICDMSLMVGFIKKAVEINHEIIDQVIKDHQQQ